MTLDRFSRVGRRAGQRILLFLLSVFVVLLAAFCLSGPSTALAAPETVTASGWAITNVAASGADGFTGLTGGRVGDNGHIVVSGSRNGSDGLFIVEEGGTIEVALVGSALPGGLGGIDTISDFNVTPDGDVLFVADVSGGSLPASPYAFRWRNGIITQQQPSTNDFVHHITKLTGDGRWLAEQIQGSPPNFTSNYRLTNGVTDQAIFSFVHTGGSCVFHQVSRQMTTPNANGTIAYYENTSTRTFQGGFCVGDTLRNWSLKLAGAANNTVASGTATVSGNTLTGSEIDDNNIMYLNNENSVAWVRSAYDGTFTVKHELVISSAQGGEQILLDTAGPVGIIFLADFDNQGRVVLQVQMDDFRDAILGGPNPTDDLVIRTQDTLFGQTVDILSLLSNAANAPAGTFGDRRAIVFSYRLQDGTTGIAVASKGVTRWTNTAGGSWATAANWSPATVPGQGDESLFDLPNTYDVNVGVRQSGRSSVEAGSVAFQSADLTLIGPFSVGGAANFSLPAGKMTANDLIVGHLPPTNPATPPTARVNIANNGTVFNATSQTIIGQAGVGDLFVNDGRLNSGEVLLGSGFPGTAVVGGVNAQWTATSLNVGAGATATLTIENGGQMVVSNAAVIGQAATLQPFPALLSVDNIGAASPALGNFSVSQLTIGDALPGTVDIQNGGSVLVVGLMQVGLRAHNTPLGDGRIIVEGTDGAGQQASILSAFEDALFGMGNGARGDWQIFGGGKGTVLGNLHLGHEAGSRGTLSVSGFSANGLRSQLNVGTDGGTEVCRVGFDGQGSANVLGGALLLCNKMNVGGNAGSRGDVLITGQSAGGTPSTLQVAKVLCVGGAALCGSGNGVTGTLTLRGGVIQADTLAVASGGHLLGQGSVTVADAFIFGEVSPELGVPVGSAEVAPTALTAVTPGTLGITGNVTMSSTAVIALDILGLSSHDQVVITGTATLGGQLILNFGEGFAPKQGDVFTFVRATGATGSFAQVVINGLAPGFEKSVTVVNGVVTLTALNDGVSTTQAAEKKIYLPLIVRPW